MRSPCAATREQPWPPQLEKAPATAKTQHGQKQVKLQKKKNVSLKGIKDSWQNQQRQWMQWTLETSPPTNSLIYLESSSRDSTQDGLNSSRGTLAQHVLGMLGRDSVSRAVMGASSCWCPLPGTHPSSSLLEENQGCWYKLYGWYKLCGHRGPLLHLGKISRPCSVLFISETWACWQASLRMLSETCACAGSCLHTFIPLIYQPVGSAGRIHPESSHPSLCPPLPP